MPSPLMSYRPLGRCGTQVSVLGLGGWTTFGASVKEEKIIGEIIQSAVEAGINFFDIANVYARGEAERAMGKVLREFPRHRLVISSKVYFPMSDDVNDRGLSRKHIFDSIEKSLQRIGTDYIDIYFCHRSDPQTPMEETARAMDDLVHQGKILYWGTSEWSGAQLQEIHELCESKNLYRPQVEQPQYNLLQRYRVEEEVRAVATSLGMGLVVWSPLESGLLTGKYDDGVPEGSRLSSIDWLREEILTEEKVERVRKFKDIAEELGVSRAQLALAWVAAQPGISSVLMGATRVDQIKENFGALSIKITEGVKQELDKIFPVKKDL
jgi:voltage-dependent potassium channel beta subunit